MAGTAERSRAKLVISDLHLGEGRRNWDGTVNVMEDFTVDSRLCEFIDYYSKAYEEVELILAGNFFDMYRCRAIEDYPDCLFEVYAVELIKNEMGGHPEVMLALKNFMKRKTNRLVYLVGEADVGVHWPRVQEVMKSQISERIEFQRNEYFDDGIYVQHGHQYDAMYSLDVREPFKKIDGQQVLKLPWGAFFYAHFIQPLRRFRPQFNRVRPMRTYLLWALGFETRFFFQIIRQFLKLFVAAFSRKLYPGNSLFDIFKIFSQAADTEALEKYAEVILSSDTTQKVIFGHAHVANYRQFRNGKEYFNTGSWTRNISLDMRSFGSKHRLTYVLLEYRSEGAEPQAKLMEWHGKREVISDYV